MPIIKSTTRVRAPLQKVFSIYTDLQNLEEVVDKITKIEILTDGPIGKGTRFRETRIMFGKEATEEMEITDFRPNESYRTEASSCGAHYVSDHRFSVENDQTLVEVTFTATPVSFVGKLLTPLSYLMKGMIKKCLDSDMELLKNYAEQAPSTENAEQPQAI